MKALLRGITDWVREGAAGWDRFWFTPSVPHSLGVIRILTGWMLLYTHLVWALHLESFLGPTSWVSPTASRHAAEGAHVWSHLWFIHSMPVLWVAHIGAMVVFLLLMLGLFTRWVSALAWLLAVSYCHRLNGALFGLDQVTAMLSMYLMIGPSGAVYSLDAWIAKRRQPQKNPAAPTTAANIAIRLIQMHMCIIYLFGGIGKMRGETWWLGDAFWLSIANYEYQSLNMTWLVRYPLLTAIATHATVFWETFYCVLIWPRWTRTLTLIMAVFVHGGIALFLGMPTFGLAMLIGNLAFISPETMQRVVGTVRWPGARRTELPARDKSAVIQHSRTTRTAATART